MGPLQHWNNWFFGWLWRASWEAALLVLLVLVAQWLLARRLPPRWRHALWLLVLARLALPASIESRMSLFNLWTPPALASLTGAGGVAEATGAPGNDLSVPVSGVAVAGAHRRAGSGVRVVWLLGALGLSGYLLGSTWRMRRKIRRQRAVTNEAVLNLLEDCRQEMNVFTPLTLLETPAIRSPALLGFVRPRLLLPEGLIDSFSLAELRFVFLHELGHLKRGDILLNWLMALPLVLHWFNPLVWLALQRIRVDGESACDAVALAHARDGENQPYGQTIIKLLERFSCAGSTPGQVGILENKTQIKHRIGLIAAFKRTSPGALPSAALFVALAVVTLTDAESQPAAQPRGDTTESDIYWRPWIVACSPRPGDSQVDPALPEITITFDRDMSEGMSWTSPIGRPYCPRIPDGQRPYWRDRRTCVLPVSLEAGHYYRVEINPTYRQDFRGADGRPADQLVLYFVTLGASEGVKARLIKPSVVRLDPPNGAGDVDPNLNELRVAFDVPMWRGYSWTGNGGEYPEPGTTNVHWIDERTCVLPVTLKPDHQYKLGINSVAAVNFQSADAGVPADPVAYTFRTRP